MSDRDDRIFLKLGELTTSVRLLHKTQDNHRQELLEFQKDGRMKNRIAQKEIVAAVGKLDEKKADRKEVHQPPCEQLNKVTKETSVIRWAATHPKTTWSAIGILTGGGGGAYAFRDFLLEVAKETLKGL